MDFFADPEEQLGMMCEIVSWAPGPGYVWKVIRVIGRTQCPDNGLTEARRQAQKWAERQLCVASPYRRWENGECITMPEMPEGPNDIEVPPGVPWCDQDRCSSNEEE